MVKYKPWKKDIVTFGYGCKPGYVETTGRCHSGIDWVPKGGYGSPVTTDSAGYVYKVFKPWQLESNWTAVYILTAHTDGTVVESVYGHLSRVDVKEGDVIQEDTQVGLSGNYGYVFSGGMQITPQMQKNGDRRGHHVHEMYRPTYRTKELDRDSHYLMKDGASFKDDDGMYYKILKHDTLFKGAVDPRKYTVKKDTIFDKLLKVAGILKERNDPDYDVFLSAIEIARKLR